MVVLYYRGATDDLHDDARSAFRVLTSLKHDSGLRLAGQNQTELVARADSLAVDILLAFAGANALAVNRARFTALFRPVVECVFFNANITFAFKHAATFSIMEAFVALFFSEESHCCEQREGKD